MSENSISVYVRNSQKMGKIIKVEPSITAEALYQAAAEAHNLKPENIHLYIQGNLIQNGQEPCQLKEKAILHLVNSQELDRETIEVKVKTLDGNKQESIEVEASITIKDFIDSKLAESFGGNSENLVLIYIGRQLQFDKSFRDEKVEHGSQLFCVNVHEVRAKHKARQAQIENHVNSDKESHHHKQKIEHFKLDPHPEVNAKNDLDLVYDGSVHKGPLHHDYNVPAEEVIPQAEAEKVENGQEGEQKEDHFKYNPHSEVNAINKVDLVYDAKVHHSSSLHDYNIPADEVIPESKDANIEQEDKEPEQGESEAPVEINEDKNEDKKEAPEEEDERLL